MPKKFFGLVLCTILISGILCRVPLVANAATGSVKSAQAVTTNNTNKQYSVIKSFDKPQRDTSNFIVRYKVEKSPAELEEEIKSRQARRSSLLGKFVNLAQDVESSLRGEPKPEAVLEDLKKLATEVKVESQKDLPLERFAIVHLKPGGEIDQAIERYRKNPAIEVAQPNYLYHITQGSGGFDPNYNSDQWNLKKIQAEQAWAITRGNARVKVAILDTGLNQQHQEFVDGSGALSPTIVNGGCFASHDSFQLDKPAVNDPCLGTTSVAPAYQCSATSIDDDNITACGGGHGTQMAGIIKAARNGKGIEGIAPEVTLIMVKVADKYGQGTSAALASGIDAARNLGAKIISISLGGPHKPADDQIVSTAIANALSANITVFAAGGNDDNSIKLAFPANDPNVITVGATGPGDERASYSNFGETPFVVEVSAPGGNPSDTQGCTASSCIMTSAWDCTGQGISNSVCYRRAAGTSHATPHAAAVAALLLSKNPSLTPDDIKNTLITTGDTVVTDSGKPVGTRVNALKALESISAGASPTSPISPTSPNSPTATVVPTSQFTPSPTIGLSETHLSGRVINLATGIGSLGLTIELTISQPTDISFSAIPPVDLDSDGNFSFRLVSSRADTAGKQLTIQFTVRDKTSNRIIRRSQPFAITLGQEIQGLNFTIYFCPKKTEGDANCDGIIDLKDFLIWKTEYRDSLTQPFQLGRADFNGDGLTDLKDYVFLVGKI